MFDLVVKNNPHLKIHRITDQKFNEYGKVIKDVNADEFIDAAKSVPYPDSGAKYIASLPEFESLDASKEVKMKYFGELPTQPGYCFGYNNMLNAMEWHKCSEVNVAITPLLLILGRLQDVVDNKIDSSKLDIFYLDKGDVVEVYATTLHYCPCQVSKEGFGAVVLLPEGTNTPLDSIHEDKLITAKNKWLLAHVDNKSLIERGFVAGVTGENYTVNF